MNYNCDTMKRQSLIIGLVLMTLIFLITPVSAGFFESLKEITGKASSVTENVTITVTGISQCAVYAVDPPSAVTVNAADAVSVTFYVTVYDADGEADIDDTAITANVSKTGQSTRFDSDNCALQNNVDTTKNNYTCTLDMWYWDANGADWTIGASCNDKGNLTANYNTSETFTVNELKYITLSPPTITWPSGVPSASNTVASVNTTVNNSGNYNGTIGVKGMDLVGTTDYIQAQNFTVDIDAGTGACDGVVMDNTTSVAVTSSNSNPGNLSVFAGQTGREELFYCIPFFPLVPSETYTADGDRTWTVAY